MNCPVYLRNYKELWEKDCHDANLAWFRNAKYGLFLHYGLYSLLHKNEWTLFNEKVPLEKYESLKEHFTAHNFDAEAIADLAVKAGMKYITMTSCHHEGFCLWNSEIEPFNSMNSPAKRDLISEMSVACEKRGLGFFVYYTFMLNWRYPYHIGNQYFSYSRPCYEGMEKRYQDNGKESFEKYIDYVETMIDELLTNYHVTGLWLDIIIAWFALGEEYIPIERIYEKIHKKHPSVLISFKQGATGTEDFASCEHHFVDKTEQMRDIYGEAAAERASRGFAGNIHKHNEICATIQNGSWSFDPYHGEKTVEELYLLMGHAFAHDCNLLLNVGPMGDGSIHPKHRQLILDLAAKIEKEGYPQKDAIIQNASNAAGAQ